MKKYLFLAAALAAMVSCSDNSFVGENGPNALGSEDGAIAFGSSFKAVTRGDTYGASAADLLGNKFIVAGVKGDGTGTGQSDVFKSYTVDWTSNTAGTTSSNTSDWEYVGKTNYFGLAGAQSVKFWDYSTTAYDFAAYSVGKGNTLTAKTTSDISTADAPADGVIYATSIDYGNAGTAAYKLRGALADLAECYITDMTTVTKANYGKEVQLNFRSLASKVRIALYETVPGYSVKEVNFYTSDGDDLKATGTGSGQLNNVDATLIGTDAFYSGGVYTVTFPNIGSGKSGNSDYNKAHVAISGSSANDTQGFGTLNYVAGEGALSVSSSYLARTSSAPSYAGTGTYYKAVLPNEAGKALELRVNYTLVSNDGSGEEIKIHGAKAFIPLTFTKWLPNYAYTYIFKISDNSNGWTSLLTSDPAGLYPITFDAVVLDSEESGKQSTITTVATPSITTYQKGHDLTKNEYSASSKIYIQVYWNGATPALRADLDTKGKLYAVTNTLTSTVEISEASVMDALNLVESGTTGRNGIILTDATTSASVNATITAIPGEDGNNITVDTKTAAEFTPTATTTYAYVYDTDTWSGTKVHLTTTPTDFTTVYYTDKGCTTLCTGTVPGGGGDYYQRFSYIYTANVTDAQPSDWNTEGVWYKDPDGVTPCKDTTWSAGTYYKRYTVNGKIYGVKVIKIAAS